MVLLDAVPPGQSRRGACVVHVRRTRCCRVAEVRRRHRTGLDAGTSAAPDPGRPRGYRGLSGRGGHRRLGWASCAARSPHTRCPLRLGAGSGPGDDRTSRHRGDDNHDPRRLHFGNSDQEPWLAINPTGWSGTAAFDAFTVVAGRREQLDLGSGLYMEIVRRVYRFAAPPLVDPDLASACCPSARRQLPPTSTAHPRDSVRPRAPKVLALDGDSRWEQRE